MNNKPTIRISTRDHDMQAWFSEKTSEALAQLSILSWLLHHPENFPQFAEKPGLGLQYIDELIWAAAEKVYTVYMLCQGEDEIDREHISAICEDGSKGWETVKAKLNGENAF